MSSLTPSVSSASKSALCRWPTIQNSALHAARRKASLAADEVEADLAQVRELWGKQQISAEAAEQERGKCWDGLFEESELTVRLGVGGAGEGSRYPRLENCHVQHLLDSSRI